MIKVTVSRDNFGANPRENDNFGTMVCWHRNYILGDIQPTQSPEEYKEESIPEGSVVLPLFLMDHSGISMSCRAFGDTWDSGQVGWIIANPSSIKAAFQVTEITEEILEKTKKQLEDEVTEYNYYLTNDCWGFIIEEVKCCSECGSNQNETIDSCCGFRGDCLDNMKEHVSEEYHEALTKAWENRF